MNIEKAKQIPIEEVLKKMNFEPSKTNGFDVWFISPFRDEKTPSFKVNTKINRWYDHGIQKGGNIIDFLQLNNNLSISEILKFLDNLTDGVVFSFQNFVEHIIPKSIVEAMATNEILQIVVFSIFFGVALTQYGEKGDGIVKMLDNLSKIILILVGYVMWFAPLGVFGGITAIIATKGLGILKVYGYYMASFL